ncbi:ABC transporter ATP-binding protein [Acidithiobacillus sp. IBUN Pt1247-S3]|uniref:ABC transporter ATP-binding protein n=1 Tax=Acidithiobacillus sp. IBUN Pt1247-S3 TaxID=3166642 RepID=UPI0034E593A2
MSCSLVSKRYGTQVALQEVSAQLQAGEIVALLGPNGAGKSTLLSCLVGLLLVDQGNVCLFGEALPQLSTQARQDTGFVPQDFNGFPYLRVAELLEFIASFYPAERRSWATLEDWADLDQKKRVRELSGGQRQRLAIVLALRHRPRVLLLDEPVSQLDPQARRDFLTLLAGHVQEREAAVLLSSHIVSDLERISSRYLVLKQGQVVDAWRQGDLPTGAAEDRLLQRIEGER